MTRLTHKEHMARAMLMGLVYDWRDRTYSEPSKWGTPTWRGMLDADTLEPVPERTAERRAVTGDWREFPDDEE